MKKLALVGLIFLFGLISCNKKNESPTNLTGTFIETSPIKNRTQIKFLSENKVIINKSPQTGTGDEFTLKITDNSIKLTPTWDNSSSVKLEFEIISDSKFQIENLYPSIPENPKTYMIFEKK